MKPRYEVRRTPAGYHVVFRAGNAETVVAGEPLKTKESAHKAIVSVTGCPLSLVEGVLWAHRCSGDVEVRYVVMPDEEPPTDLTDHQAGGKWALTRQPIVDFLEQDKFIHAIKAYRDPTGASLTDAKEAVWVAKALREGVTP